MTPETRYRNASDEPIHAEDWQTTDRRLSVVIWSIMVGLICLALGFYFGIKAI